MPKILLDTSILPRQGKLQNVVMSAVLRVANADFRSGKPTPYWPGWPGSLRTGHGHRPASSSESARRPAVDIGAGIRATPGRIKSVGGLHFTGVVQVGGPPRTPRSRGVPACWMSARRWRGRRDLASPLTGDDVAVADRVVADGELEHPVEDEPAASRAAVEAEHELVQVALQVRLVD